MPASPPGPSLPPTDEAGAASALRAEQDHLDRARAELARMRDRALSAQASGGDRVSSEFLAATLWRRAQSLTDDGSSALFFGRLDLDHPLEGAERWYVGRRHVADEAGDPLVIDWRAPLSGRFYRATRTAAMDVVLRRRFGVDQGRITAYEDEHLQAAAPAPGDVDAGAGGHSAILAREIERPRVGPMRDIVATIQPEQDEIVRSGAGETVCVQGAPGTGKTAVGLHRAAWLLYAHRERLDRAGVLVVGPNAAFLDHIGAVLPALGELSVGHSTAAGLVAAWASAGKPVGADPTAVAMLKGDARLAEVLRRAVWSHVIDPSEPCIVPRGAHRWRVPAYEVAEIVSDLRARSVRYDAARAMLPQRLAHAVLLRMEAAGDSPDDRVHDSVARSAAVRRYAGSMWPAVDPRQVLFGLLSDPEVLARHAAGILDEAEQQLLLWPRPPRTKASARWSEADLVLLDELGDIIERTPSLGHVVLDEAQDLSPMQLRAIGHRCETGSMTILGDIAQGTTPWATDSWETSLIHLGKPGSHVEVLDRGFRVPAQVIDLAARLLPHMAPGLGAPVSVRDNPGELKVVAVSPGSLMDHVAGLARAAAGREGSVGVVAPDARIAELSRACRAAGLEHGVLGADRGDVEHQVDLVPASVAKGLEFDRVVVVDPAGLVAAEPDRRTGLRRLYVVLTRAVSSLTIVHAGSLPPELGMAD